MKRITQVSFRKIRMIDDLADAFRKLKSVRQSPEFREYREQYLELILGVLTMFGILFILGLQLLDLLLFQPDFRLLFWMRIGMAALLILNFSMYLFYPNRNRLRIFVYIGFYLMATMAPGLTYLTGGLESPFWLDLVFILIVWFVIIPFDYRILGIHALAFIAIYTVILFSMETKPFSTMLLMEHGFIFIGAFVIGLLVAIFNSLFSASAYLSEQRVAASEKRFRMFTQNSLDVVWTMDFQSGCFTYVSPSVYQLRGYRPDELIGQPVLGSLTPESRLRLQEIFDQAKAEIRKGNTEKVLIGELEQVTKTGETVWIEVITSFVTGEKGEILEVIGDSRNITERKKAESALMKIQQQLQEESNKLYQENLKIQYESLKNQINPHFLFNSLNVLASLIRLDARLAEKFTEQMAKVYRYVLEHKEEDVVSLRTELDFIRSYIFLLEIRFPGKVSFDIRIPEEYLNCNVPPLTIQLLIENAVKHNVFSRKFPLVLQLFIDPGRYFNVVNNLQKREVKMGSTAVGLQNITTRFRQLTDREPEFGEQGDRFVARIPLL